ncbi:hypothetical protein [Streptomyces sp. NPDC001070]
MDEWGEQISPADAAELGRYQHFASFTVGGKRVGPLRIRGPELNDVFRDLYRPSKPGSLLRAAHDNTGAKPLSELTAVASTHEISVLDFLTGQATGSGAGQPSTTAATKPQQPSQSAADVTEEEKQYR